MTSPISSATDGPSSTRGKGAFLGLDIRSVSELIPQLERGFPFKVLLNIHSQTGIPVQVFAEIIGLTPRTLARRRSAGKMTLEESERILRISGIFERAVQLFEGNKAAAVKWLTTPRKYFDHQTPLQYSRTEVGAREVESLIYRLEHGVIA